MIVPLSEPDITRLEIDAVTAVLKSTRLSLGPCAEKFEALLAAHVGVPHGVAVSSGTAALHLCLLALHIGRGDEVIVPSFAFIAVAKAVCYVGAIPVFVDVDPASMNIDPLQIEAALTVRTRAIIVVHTFGLPVAMQPITRIASKHGLRVIEDACEALGATCDDRQAGSFGDLAVSSSAPSSSTSSTTPSSASQTRALATPPSEPSPPPSTKTAKSSSPLNTSSRKKPTMLLSRKLRSAGISALFLAAATHAQTPSNGTNEERAAAVFNRVKNDESRLRIFLQAMPKGANLHNHLDGSVYTETYVRMAAERGFCADFAAQKITPPPCHTPADELKGMGMRDPGRYENFINLISRRTFRKALGYDVPGGNTGGGGFPAIYAISVVVPAGSMALSRSLAANDHETYTEFIYQPDLLDRTAAAVDDPLWNPDDLEAAYSRALPRLRPIVQQAVADFERDKADADKALGCVGPNPAPVCNLEVRFLSYARRGDRQDQVFQAILMAFLLADADPNYVGFNLVGPESKESAVADYDLNMRMIHVVGAHFPRVHRTLHAGEQTLGKQPPDALLDHEKKAIQIAGAERIGHGTSIAFEQDAVQTLVLMAREHIAVEINLTSNDRFGAFGSYHPLNLYRAAGVPVTLSTDNTGMARVDLSNEYVRAAYEHKLDYQDLKYVARTGMQVAFLPGLSLWSELQIGVPVLACRHDVLGEEHPSPACSAFLSQNPKAKLQWRYEKELTNFEREVRDWRF